MATGDRYVLIDHKPVLHKDLMEWFNWYEIEENRRVAGTQLGDIFISTVFTGWDITPDHCLFETMIFGGRHDRRYVRCNTWEAAERMHRRVVRVIEREEI